MRRMCFHAVYKWLLPFLTVKIQEEYFWTGWSLKTVFYFLSV